MLVKPLSIPGVLHYYYINFFSRLNYIVFSSCTQCRNHNGKFCAMDDTSKNRWLSHLGLETKSMNLHLFSAFWPMEMHTFVFSKICMYPSIKHHWQIYKYYKIVLWMPQRIAWGKKKKYSGRYLKQHHICSWPISSSRLS